MIKHRKFGRVCMCDCHKDGTDIREFMPCCNLYRQKYIDEDGTLDEARLLAIYESRGIPLWTWVDHLKDWFRRSWPVQRWRSWRMWRRLKHYKLPVIEKVYPNLRADDIVSAQPMTAPIPEGIFKYEYKGDDDGKG